MPLPKRILESWPEDGETVEFRLIFRGNLPSDRYAGVDVKHNIRRQLHPQLRTLWEQVPSLKHAFDPKMNYRQKGKQSRIDELAAEYGKYGFDWIPLVKKREFACALDILILLRQGPFGVLNRGDLDNRIKTLVDGLCIPDQPSAIAGQLPASDENPFFVLMDDDAAVFEFQVSAERLLIPPEAGEPERDVTAIIGVRVTTLGGNPIAYMSGEF